jgi:hypothetical protein
MAHAACNGFTPKRLISEFCNILPPRNILHPPLFSELLTRQELAFVSIYINLVPVPCRSSPEGRRLVSAVYSLGCKPRITGFFELQLTSSYYCLFQYRQVRFFICDTGASN